MTIPNIQNEWSDNFSYDSFILASEFNNVIRHIKLNHHPDLDDRVQVLMTEYMMRVLTRTRDGLLHQALGRFQLKVEEGNETRNGNSSQGVIGRSTIQKSSEDNKT